MYYKERVIIEQYLKDKVPKEKIAKKLWRNSKTIEIEIKRERLFQKSV